MIWSDHGTNFVGANKQKPKGDLDQQRVQGLVSEFCSSGNLFRNAHRGLWEAAVKTHLKRVTTNVKLTYEEMTTVLNQTNIDYRTVLAGGICL